MSDKNITWQVTDLHVNDFILLVSFQSSRPRCSLLTLSTKHSAIAAAWGLRSRSSKSSLLIEQIFSSHLDVIRKVRTLLLFNFIFPQIQYSISQKYKWMIKVSNLCYVTPQNMEAFWVFWGFFFPGLQFRTGFCLSSVIFFLWRHLGLVFQKDNPGYSKPWSLSPFPHSVHLFLFHQFNPTII